MSSGGRSGYAVSLKYQNFMRSSLVESKPAHVTIEEVKRSRYERFWLFQMNEMAGGR